MLHNCTNYQAAGDTFGKAEWIRKIKQLSCALSVSEGEECCTFSGILVVHHTGTCFFADFIYKEKFYKPVLPWLFLIFRDGQFGARVILQKCPWTPMYRKYRYYTTQVSWFVGNLWHLAILTFQCDFKFKICLAKYDHRNLICEDVKSSFTSMTWFEEKTDLKRACRFLRTNEIPL